ncbi:MAG: sulfotransferase domain-containing protein [Candidatus Rhabdochlamydia sp.]
MKTRWIQTITFFIFLCAARASFCSFESHEPILLIPLEKSASVYITKTLASSLKRKIFIISDENVYPRQDIVESRLKLLVKEKGVAREHLKASSHNLDLLKKYNIKVLFHVRDLRQHVISLAHHQLDRKAYPDIVRLYQKRGCDISSWTLQNFIEAIITYLPETVEIMKGWIKVHKEQKIPILITSYEDFSDAGALFFDKIFHFYSIPPKAISLCKLPKTSYYHFRKGTKNEWKTALSIEQQKRIEKIIPDEFFDFFGWEK